MRTFRLCLVPKKKWEKMQGKENRKESRMKEKVKETKK